VNRNAVKSIQGNYFTVVNKLDMSCR